MGICNCASKNRKKEFFAKADVVIIYITTLSCWSRCFDAPEQYFHLFSAFLNIFVFHLNTDVTHELVHNLLNTSTVYILPKSNIVHVT
ncbi:unnamed protein product [Caenorhabditis sp. 36 PRJEB53466]|nr:unnamed protein product [Caenorhabditis sp. 36 PRJEB53466]